MFPTDSHRDLIEYAFKVGGGNLGIGGGGLSISEVASIDLGSRLTDTLFGTGQLFNWLPPFTWYIDPPITLIQQQAPNMR